MRFVLIIVVGNIKSTILTVGQEGSVEVRRSSCAFTCTCDIEFPSDPGKPVRVRRNKYGDIISED